MATYPYGSRLGPAIGGGLPGLPRRQSGIAADITAFPTQVIYVSADATIQAPSWATKSRISLTGNGANGAIGANAGGGGGAGFAGTNIESISPGQPINIKLSTTTVQADGLGYQLKVTPATVGANGIVLSPGGVGSGGAVNYTGGSGGLGNSIYSGGGGGAASRGGNGSDGVGGTSSGYGAPGQGAARIGYFSQAGWGGSQYQTSIVLGLPPTPGPMILIGTSVANSSNMNATVGGGGGSGNYSGTAVGGLGSNGFAIVEFW